MNGLLTLLLVWAGFCLMVGAGPHAWRIVSGVVAVAGVGPFVWCCVLGVFGSLVALEVPLGMAAVFVAVGLPIFAVVRFVRRWRALRALLTEPRTSHKKRLERD